MTNTEISRVQLAPRSQMEEMAQMLLAQGRKLRELEIRLQKEKQDKANLEIDFQHLLDQLNFISSGYSMSEDSAVVCG